MRFGDRLKNKKTATGVAVSNREILSRRGNGLALAGLEALIALVDDVNAAFAAHHDAVFIAGFSRFQRISDLHGLGSGSSTVGIYLLPIFNKSAENRG